MEDVIYKDIKDYEGLYQAGNNGTIKSLLKVRFINGLNSFNKRIYPEIILKSSTCSKNGNGYEIVTLHKDGKPFYATVHRLVLSTFIENINNLPSINHINGNRIDNRLINLEWCTNSYNSQHAYINGKNPGSWNSKNNPSSKRCMDISNGKIYDTVLEAREKSKTKYSYVYLLKMLSGEIDNKTNLVLL